MPPSLSDLANEVRELRQLVIRLLNTPRLHRSDLMIRYGFSEATLHRLMRAEKIPAPIRFTGPLWRLADLEAAEIAGQLPRPVSS